MDKSGEYRIGKHESSKYGTRNKKYQTILERVAGVAIM